MDFNGALLAKAIRATFAQRKTPISEGDPVGLTSRFYDDALRKAAWVAFGKKIDPSNRSLALGEVVLCLREFLIPPLTAAATEVK